MPDPADAYFQCTTSSVDGTKDPWLLNLPEHKGFSFAGIWAHNDHLGVTSWSIITARTVEHIAHIDGRTPVILEESVYDAWLSGLAKGDNAKATFGRDSAGDRTLATTRINGRLWVIS